MLGLVLVALLVPALMITVVRVLQPEGGRWIRLVSFTPYAIALYSVALLFLLLVIAAGRGRRRKAGGLVALLVVPLLALHAFWASGPYSGEVAAAEGERFTVLTANLAMGDADASRVVALAVTNDVDALVLSEITHPALGRMNAAGLSRVFPYAEGETAPSVKGTMVFSKEQPTEVVRLKTTFDSLALTLPVGERGTLQLVAVHPHPPVGDAREWRADHQTIHDFVAQNEAAADTTVIAGDFNATPDHEAMSALEDLGFRSAADQSNAQWQPTWPSAGGMSLLGVDIPSLLQIDHVLVTDNAEAVNTESVTVQGTDHRAVVATVTLQ